MPPRALANEMEPLSASSLEDWVHDGDDLENLDIIFGTGTRLRVLQTVDVQRLVGYNDMSICQEGMDDGLSRASGCPFKLELQPRQAEK